MQQFYYDNYSPDFDFPDLLKLFKLQAKLGDDNTSETINELVDESREFFIENSNIMIKYTFADILQIKDSEIILDTENKAALNGSLLPSLLKDCNSICLYTLSVNGYQKIQQLCDEDIMLSFFADAWGTAYAEAACNCFLKQLQTHVENNKRFMTIAYNPGQHMFPLTNQRIIFDLLSPNDINLTLTDSCLMQPSKSISGVIGISHIPQDLSKVPCDYCDMRNTCPSAYVSCRE